MINIKKEVIWRVYIVYIFMLILGLSIIGRIVYIQFFEGNIWKDKAMKETVKDFDIKSIRGTIYSSDGRVLATSVPIFDVRMDVNSNLISDDFFYGSIDSLSFSLANLFKDKHQQTYRNNLVNARKNGNRFYLVKRNVKYAQLKKMRTFPIFRRGKYKGGMIIIPKDRREMPFKLLSKRTIGYSRKGYYVGLEGAYNKELKGVSGKRLMQKIAKGVWMPLNDENLIEPEHGKDIISTINVNFQDVAESALMKQIEYHQADHGCAVLMEVSTGHIKAIANLKRDTATGRYEESYNYAVGESSEPGSTFKLASFLVALEDNKFNLDDSINTGNGITKYYDRTMEDSHKGGYGKISVQRAFEVSSNVGVSKLIYKAYSKDPQKFIDGLYKLKLNQPLGIEIKGEGKPQIKSPKQRSEWYGTTLPWMSIGYEISMTPLQILALYNAVANDGVMVKPMLVKAIMQTGEIVENYETVVLNEAICSKKTIDKAKIMLEGVVENGTAKNLKTSIYKIAGKTGTAQIALGSGGYNKTDYKASFVGYFPASNPKYSCIVVINNPKKGIYYGGWIAGPVFKEIADKVYATQLEMQSEEKSEPKNYLVPISKAGNQNELEKVYQTLNISTLSSNPTAEWVMVSENNNTVKFKTKNVKYGLVPNVKGMNAKDAIFLLERLGLCVEILGKGFVREQSKEPGTKIIEGKKITLELKI